MKERPILFSAPMVRALLAGTKTQTRRIVKLPTERTNRGGWEATTIGGVGCTTRPGGGDPVPEMTAIWNRTTGTTLACPYGDAGDRLWVKETHALATTDPPQFLYGPLAGLGVRKYGGGEPVHRGDLRCRGTDVVVAYREHPRSPTELAAAPYFETWRQHEPKTWRPSIFMPRWASRIALEVTGVRVEQLHAITEEDARAEGTSFGELQPAVINGEPGKVAFFNAHDAFAYLWTAINGAESWKANPWVWVVEFKRVAQPSSEPPRG